MRVPGLGLAAVVRQHGPDALHSEQCVLDMFGRVHAAVVPRGCRAAPGEAVVPPGPSGRGGVGMPLHWH